MFLAAVTLLTISAGCVLSAPQNTQAALENDLRAVAGDMAAAGINTFDNYRGVMDDVAAAGSSDPTQQAFQQFLQTFDFQSFDIQSIMDAFEKAQAQAQADSTDVKQQRKRQAAVDDAAAAVEQPSELQTSSAGSEPADINSQYSEDVKKAIALFYKYLEQYQAQQAQLAQQTQGANAE